MLTTCTVVFSAQTLLEHFPIMDVAERLFYSYPYEPRRRTKPMEVITFGLSRSGTESLAVALRQLGHENVWHGYNLVDQAELYEPWVRLMRRKWGSGRGWLDRSSRLEKPGVRGFLGLGLG